MAKSGGDGTAAGGGGPVLDLMDATETAEYIKCSRQHVYDMAKREELPSVRYGGRIVFIRADINRWLLSKRAGLFCLADSVQAGGAPSS